MRSWNMPPKTTSVVPIADSPYQPSTLGVAFAHEIATIYPGASDRFVVSIVFGYSKHDGGIDTVKQAAKAALDYVRNETDGGTVWHVFDRHTGEMFALEEHEFVNEPEPKEPKSYTPDCTGIGPDAGTDRRHRHPSEGRLIAPDGTKVPGGFMCREHATVVIDEYKAKLGETWTFQELP